MHTYIPNSLNLCQTNMPSYCLHCGLCASPALECVGCRGVVYCSKACQRADWRPHHKAVCQDPHTAPLLALIRRVSSGRLTIRHVEGKGRGLFTTTDVDAGEVLLTDHDALWVLEKDIVGISHLFEVLPLARHLACKPENLTEWTRHIEGFTIIQHALNRVVVHNMSAAEHVPMPMPIAFNPHLFQPEDLETRKDLVDNWTAQNCLLRALDKDVRRLVDGVWELVIHAHATRNDDPAESVASLSSEARFVYDHMDLPRRTLELNCFTSGVCVVGRNLDMLMLSVPIALANHSCCAHNAVKRTAGVRRDDTLYPPLRPTEHLVAERAIPKGHEVMIFYARRDLPTIEEHARTLETYVDVHLCFFLL